MSGRFLPHLLCCTLLPAALCRGQFPGQEANSAGNPAVVYAAVLPSVSTEARNRPRIAVDSTGAAFISGFELDQIATPSGQAGFVDRAWLAKLNPAGDRVVFRRVVQNAWRTAVTVDRQGNAYFAGILDAAGVDYDTTPGALNQAGGLGFVMKLSPGGEVLYAARLAAEPYAVAVDREGNVYLTGIAREGFVATPGSFDTTLGADCPTFEGPNPTPCSDAFAARLSSDGSRLDWATMLGGATQDSGSAIALDESGAVYVSGETASADFPTTPGGMQETFGGSVTLGPLTLGDGFLVKLDTAGRTLLYGTFLGGSQGDSATGLAVSPEGIATVVGTTQSPDFPVSANAFQRQYGGGPEQPARSGDVFFVQIGPSGAVLQSSYLGGADSEASGDAALFPDGRIAVTTWSGVWRGPCERLNHLLVFSANGALAVHDLKGLADSSGPAVTVGEDGDVYLAGWWSGPTDFIVTQDALADGHVLAAKVDLDRSAGASADCVANAASLAIRRIYSLFWWSPTVAPGAIVSIFGRQLGPAEGVSFSLDAAGRVPTTLGGSRVLVNGIEAPLLYVSDRQINAVAPFDLPMGEVTIQIESDQGRTREHRVESFPVFPGIFSLDATGYGQAAALNEDGTLNSPANPARRGSVVSIFATGLGEFAPAPGDGSIVPVEPPFPQVAQPFQLYIGAAVESGAAGMEILYAGAAPGLVAGVAQINARIPPLARSGDAVPVRLVTEFERSQEFLTIAVE